MQALYVLAGILAGLVCTVAGIAIGAYLYHQGQLGQPPLTILRPRSKHVVRPAQED